jgi:hypothetical protein
MANPSRIHDPRLDDPINPATTPGVDPLTINPRLDPANSQDPRVANSTVVQSRSGGTGVLIAAVIIVLALAAYFLFAPGSQTTVVPTEPAVTTEPATPAPDATAPAAPGDTIAPAPDATAPAEPADPVAPAPESSAPAPAEPTAPAPAAPAAPAQ